MWFADVGKSELGKQEIKKKHAQYTRSTVHRTGDLIIVRTVHTHTHTQTGSIDRPGPLKWSVITANE